MPDAMTAPRAREQAGPPSPPERRPSRRGGGPSPYIYAASAAGRPADPARPPAARRGLVRSARALAAAALLALAVPAQAQTATTLVSNTGETVGSQVTSIAAQPFTTGSAAVLASVDIRLGPIAGVGPPRVRILQDDSGSPGAELVTLVNPSSIVNAAVNNFTAPANTTLLADTTYYVELSRRQTTNLGVVTYEPGRGYRVTGSDEQTGLTNWNIGDSRYYKETSGATSWRTSSSVMMFAIKGTTGEGVPLVTGTAVTSSPAANGNYETGEVIEVTVTFSEAVTVDTASGTPRLALNIGSNTRHAIYSASDSTTTALVFAYPVVANDRDNDGISIDAGALELNGGAIHKEGDASTNAVLNQGALSTQSGHRVNRADALIVSGGVSVISTPRAATDTYGAGEIIEIEVVFTNAVTATTGTDFVLSVAGAKRAPLLRGNGTDTLVFGYTVQAADSDGNGIWIGDQDRTLVGNRNGTPQTGAITSVATGRAAGLTHADLGTLSGHKVDGSLTPPTSTDATLSALSLGTGVTLSPTFASDTYAYTASVASGVGEVTFAATPNHGEATVRYLTGTDVLTDEDSTEDGFQVELDEGANAITVEVTAEDGTTQTYTVTVTRAAGATAPVWSATMTAGDTQVGHGYDATDTPAVGTLDDDDFVYESLPHTVLAIDVGNVVRFVVEGGLPMQEALTLEFGGHALAFSDRISVISINQSRVWNVPDALDDLATEFPVGSTATVCLRTATQVCPAGRIVTPSTLPTLSVADAAGTEGGNVTFTATLSATAAADVTATWTASIGSGDTAADADLGTAKTGMVTVPMGETEATFPVPTAQDTTDEYPETFTVMLSGVSANATLGTATAMGTIIDNDDTPTMSVGDVSGTEGEGLTFTVELSAASGRDVSVKWRALAETGYTATEGTDFTAATGTLAFDAGPPAETEKTFTVQTTDDMDVENDETFKVELIELTNAGIAAASDGRATGTIENDDAPGAPADFRAEVGDTQVELAWDAPAPGANITRHEVRRKEGSGSYPAAFTPIPASAPGGANEKGYTVTGLTNEVAYTFELRAVNDAGNGTAAEARPVTPTPGICDRTQVVRDGILDEVPGVTDCKAVTVANLAAITGTLDLEDEGITSLQSGDFAGLTALDRLYLPDNDFSSLPLGVFSGLTGLTRLYLHDNDDLTSLPDGVFAGLTALENIRLYGTGLTSLPDGAFDGLTALETLRLHNNQLTSLPDEVFDGLMALKTLHLSGNDLSSLPDEVFKDLTALTSLTLNDNDLDALPDGAFTGLTALAAATLSLGNNPNSGDDLPLTVTVEKVGTDQARAKVAAGAPFAVDFTPTVVNGSLPASDTKLAVAAGSVDGTAQTVTRTSGTTAAVTVDIDLSTQPSLPTKHSGYAFAKATGSEPTEILSAETALPALSIADANADEGVAVEFTVTLSEAAAADVTVTWTASLATGDTAETGDFTDLSVATGTLTFSASTSQTTATFTVATAEDTTAERDETFTVTLSGVSTNAQLAADPTAEGTINDDDTPTSCTLNTGDLWCSVVTVGEREDYYGYNGFYGQGGLSSNRFSVGAQQYTINILSVAGASKEDTGNLTLDLAEFPNATEQEALDKLILHLDNDALRLIESKDGAPGFYYWENSSLDWSSKVYFIARLRRNDAPVFSASTAAREVDENSAAGTDVGDPVTASDDDSDTLTYSLEGTDKDSFAIDSGTGQITTIAGVDYNHEATKNSYAVTVKADDGIDSDTIDVTIGVADVAEQSDTPAKPELAAVTGSTTSLDASWTKPDLNGGPEITGYNVQYREAPDGTWEDFAHTGTAVTTTITGLTASTEYQARVRAENGETDSDWSDPSDAVSTALPTLSVGNASATEGSSIFFPLTLSAAAGELVAVNCVASFGSGDTAVAADLSTNAGATSIRPGETSGRCTIRSAQDSTDEEDETFTVTLSGVSSNVQLGTPSTAKGTIEDDDDPPTVTVADAMATEGGKVEFAVTLTAVSGRDVTVDYATSVGTDQTATSGTDFTAANGTLTILAADATDTGTIEVQTTEDSTDEDDETFTLTISNPTNATLGTKTAAAGTIEDDDGTMMPVTPPDVLVSNYPDGSATDLLLNFLSQDYIAQTFTAGAGFTLTAVGVHFRRVPDNARMTVSLHALDGSNPGRFLANLDLSGTLAVGDNTFVAPAGTTLAAGEYFVRLRWRSGDRNLFPLTKGPDAETSAASGWSIRDRSRFGDGSSWSWYSDPFAMRVRGTINAEPRVATGAVRIESGPVAHDSYGVGEDIEVAVGFTDDVTVDTASGTPRIALTVGSNTRYAAYSAGDSSADELAFVYQVTADDHDQDGVSIAAAALELNGGAIHMDGDSSTNAVLDHAALDADSDHRVNRDPFIVSDGVSVISTPTVATDTYGLGEVIEIEVEFSAAVNATTGTDFVLSVAGARRAPLLRGSGTATLVFGYTVVSGDDDDDGIWIGDQDRTLVGNRNGEPQNGAITSAVTDRAADLDHDEPGVLSGHKVDGSQTPPVSADATLSALSLGTGVTVSQSGNAYTASVANSVDEVTVTPTTNHAEATYEYLDSSDTALPDADSNTAGHQVALTVGATVFKVKVTAEDGTTTQTYTVTVTRAEATACTLNTGDFWCGVVMVEDIISGGSIVGHGFSGSTGDIDGNPDDKEFTVPSTNNGYTITSLLVGAGRLVISLDETLSETATANDRAILELGIDDGVSDPFPLSNTFQSGTGYRWNGTGLDWSMEPTVTVRLREGDPPTLSVADATGAEGDQAVEFTATLSKPRSTESRATWTASIESGDTAVAADLGSTRTGTVTIPVNALMATFEVPVVDDAANEDDETFTVTLSSPYPSASVKLAADPTATGTIEDDDGSALPTLSVDDAEATEGSPVSFTVALSAAAAAEVTVAVATSVETGDTAISGTDFTAASETLTFAAGETSKTVTVATTGDELAEGNETFTLTLSNPANATLSTTAATATGTIEDDDQPTVGFENESIFIVEETGEAVFKVKLDKTSTVPITVDWATEADSAEADVDYTEASGTLTFAAGDTEETITVAILDEDLLEGLDVFTVRLSGTDDALVTLGRSSSTGRIIDRDTATITFAEETTVDEDAGTVTLTLTASAPSTRAYTVGYETEDGTAKAGTDYTAASEEVRFPALETERTITITVLEDTADEEKEDFAVRLALPSDSRVNVADGPPPRVLIEDNDDPPTLSVADVEAEEGEDLVFTVALSAASGKTVTVAVATSVETGDTATSGTDFTAVGSTTLTFTAGQEEKTVTVQTTEDTTNEENETFTVTLSGPTNATLSTTAATAKGTIADDDGPNAAPSFTSSAARHVAENTTAVVTVTATDADAGDDVTGYAITGGSDQALFEIGAATGVLTFKSAPNFEDALDQGTDNDYVVVVQATSGMGTRVMTADLTITVTVTNADEGQSGTVTIDDTAPMVGDELTASTANAADPDGLPDPFAPAWKWYRTPDGGSETEITGETSATYTVVAADLDATLAAKASWTDKGGFANTLSSAPTSAVATLPTLSIGNASATEGSLIRFPLTLSAAPGEIVSVQCIASFETGDTAAAADLASDNSTATIQIGSTSGSCAISSAQDTIDEENETFTVTLSNPSSNAQLAADPTAKGTINDNDDPPTLSVADVEAEEGEDLVFTVALSAASGKTVTVAVATSVETGDTATSGTDFTAVGSTTLTFTAGQEEKTVTVQTTEDTTEEENETFTVTLSGPTNAGISDPTAKGTIVDDDTAPTVTDVSVTSTPVLETDTYGAGETILFTVTLSEAVTVTGDPEFAFSLDTGEDRAAYKSGSGTTALVFGYTVLAADEDDDGIFLLDGSDFNNRDGAVTLDSDDAIKAAGSTTDADLAHTGRGTESGHKVDGTRSIVSVAVTSTPQLESDTYGAGETIQFTVTFNVRVDVDGDPVVEFLFDGSEVRQAGYVSGSGSTGLVFHYLVVSGDDDDNGLFIRDESDYNNPDGPIRLDSNDEIKFKDTSTDVPLYWAGRGTQSGHKVDGSRTTGNTAPSFTSLATFDAAENQTTVGTVAATDSDADDSVTGYEITGGADQALFEIGATSGELTFKSAPNYEDPQDSGTDNVHEVTVRATSGAGTREMTADQTIAVTVTNADEGQSGTVTIDDTTPMVGDELTASTANAADPDGLPDPFAPTWKWYRTPDGGSETEITGETSATYTVVAADLGATLTAKASWTDKGGFANTLSSAPTSAVAVASALPALSVGNASATEGAVLHFPLTLSAAASENVTVTCTASFESGDTAVAADLSPITSGTATITAGGTSGTCSILSVQDTIDEDDETFTVTLTEVLPSGHAQLAADPTAKGTIVDDDTAPTVTGVEVTSEPVLETDTYGAGERIEVSVTFSEAVNATSATDFVLSVAGAKRAPLVSGSGTATLVFGYTVAPGDADDDGIWIGDDTRTLVGDRNGNPQAGAIASTATDTAADLDHTGLPVQSGHKVDGSRSIVSVAVSSTPQLESDTYGAGETIQFTVTFNVAVDVDGDPVLKFVLGNSGQVREVDAAYVTGGGGTALVFGYTVVSTDVDNNGIYLRDEQDYDSPDGPVRLDSNDEIEFKDTSTDVPLYWQAGGTTRTTRWTARGRRATSRRPSPRRRPSTRRRTRPRRARWWRPTAIPTTASRTTRSPAARTWPCSRSARPRAS